MLTATTATRGRKDVRDDARDRAGAVSDDRGVVGANAGDIGRVRLRSTSALIRGVSSARTCSAVWANEPVLEGLVT